MVRARSFALVVSLAAFGGLAPSHATAFDVILNAQGEYLDAYLTQSDGIHAVGRYAFDVPDPVPHSAAGRHLNGKVCFFPANAPAQYQGKFVASDDTFDEVCVDPILHGQTPDADRCSSVSPNYVGNDPAGWGVMNNDGTWAHEVIHAAGCGPNGQGDVCDLQGINVTDPQSLGDAAGPMATQGTIDPQGCFFDKLGNLWGTDVGHDGDPTDHDGALIVFFAASNYKDYCFVDRALFSPAMPEYDPAGQGAIYLAESGAGHVNKYVGPFPTSAADCAVLPDHTVTIPPLKTVFTAFPLDLTLTPASIVRKPGTDHFYLASVLLLGSINEIDANGIFSGFAAGPFIPNVSLAGTRVTDNPIIPTGVNPEGVDVGTDGTVYFSDLNLQTDPTTFTFFSTGCGRMWKTAPGGVTPTLMADHLRFPDGVTVVDSSNLDLSKLSTATGLDFCNPESP
jgi:hypothetical protein